MIRKFFLPLLIVAVITGGSYYGWQEFSRRQQEAAALLPKSQTAKVERRDIEDKVEISGDVAPAFQVDVKPEVSGRIIRLMAVAGEEVKKGDLLAEIDDSDLQTQKAEVQTDIEGAQLTVDKNKRIYERGQELYKAKLISKEVFENLMADYEIAGNALNKANRRMQTIEEKISRTKVLCPADGTILSVSVLEGQVVVAAQSVSAGTSLLVVASLSKLLVNSHVNQIDVANIKLGQDVKLECEALRGVKMDARVSFIAPVASVKNNVKGFSLELVIEKPNPRLRPGMTVSLDIPIASVDDAVSVPISGIFSERNDEKVVYVRQGTDTIRRSVQVGISDLFFTQITSGLEPGEEILLVKPKENPSQPLSSKGKAKSS